MMNPYLVVFFAIVLSYVVFSLVYFWFSTDKYVENSQGLRKSFYVLFVLGIGFGIILKEIDLKNWQLLLQFTAIFVFIDVAVFQTPDILKLWKAEFQHTSYFRSIIKANQEIIGNNTKKVEGFSDIIAKTADHFENKTIPQHWRQYKDELRTYLNLYADIFQFHISIFEFNSTTDADELKNNVAYAFHQVELCYNKTIESGEWKDLLVQLLISGKTIELKEKKEKTEATSPLILEELKNRVFIVAYYGKTYNMLIGVSSKFIEVNAIDASHILNLAQIYDWYMG